MYNSTMSIHIEESVDLSVYNTFGISVKAKYFTRCINEEQVKEALKWCQQNNQVFFVLGGGSNMLLLSDIDALVVKIEIGGIAYINDSDQIISEAGAGVVWHDWVMDTLSKGYSGLENLSLIPGNVGASPIQNIGAYGVELKDIFISLDAI